MDPKGWKKVQEQNYAHNQAIVQVLRKKVINQEKSKFLEEKKNKKNAIDHAICSKLTSQILRTTYIS